MTKPGLPTLWNSEIDDIQILGATLAVKVRIIAILRQKNIRPPICDFVKKIIAQVHFTKKLSTSSNVENRWLTAPSFISWAWKMPIIFYETNIYDIRDYGTVS